MNLLTIKYGDVSRPGGMNEAVRKINQSLCAMGHSCSIFTTTRGFYSIERNLNGVRTIWVGSLLGDYSYGLSPRVLSALKRYVNRTNPDIIHLHGYHGLFSFQVLLFLKQVVSTSTPIIFSPHYDPRNHSTIAGKSLGNLFDKVVGKQVFQMADFIVSVSDYEARNLRKRFEIANNLVVIPHGVDDIAIKRRTREGGTLVLLYVGYLLEYKGIQYGLKALREIVHERGIKDVRLTIVGEGGYKADLVEQARKLEVLDYVEWRSFQSHSDILAEMRAADVLLLLSESEGYGIVVAESLAVGTPAIVTRGTALEEFTLEPGCFGVSLDRNPGTIADVILRIRESPPVVGPFSRKIRRWDEVARDYEDLCREISD